MTVITRRTMLTGAVSAVGAVNVPVTVAAEQGDLATFVDLSAALTGIDKDKLAPGLDPINIKKTYYDKARGDPAFDDLIARWKKQLPGSNAGVFFTDRDAVRYLARNIIIAWYLGAWCDPADLRKYDDPNPPIGAPPSTVISSAAYTQGWAWRVAQAHPMGYSELRFGYWADQPFTLQELTGAA
jgi:hypothetical protein